MRTVKALALMGLLALCACKSPSAVSPSNDAKSQAVAPVPETPPSPRQHADDAAAVVANPTLESRAELHDVVSSALHDAPVQLAENALTISSLLLIERKTHRTLEGRVGNDRSLEAPEKFQLVLEGSRCVLVHVNTGVRYWLTHTHCKPAPRT